MTTFKVMIEFRCQSQIAYVGAETGEEAIAKVNTRYDGTQLAKAQRAYVFGTAQVAPDIV